MANSGFIYLKQEECRHLMEKKKYSNALAKWKALLKEEKLTVLSRIVILSNIMICCVYEENEEFDETKELQDVNEVEWLKIKDEVMRHSQKLEKMGNFLEAFVWIRIIFRLEYKNRNSLKIVQHAKRIIRKTKESENKVISNFIIGFLENILEMMQKTHGFGDEETLPNFCLKLGQCYEMIQDYKMFCSRTEKALKACESCYGEECVKHKIYGKILHNLGVAFMFLERFEEAEQVLHRAEVAKQSATDYAANVKKEKCISKTKELLQDYESKVRDLRKENLQVRPKQSLPTASVLQTSAGVTLRKSSSIGFDGCVVSFRTTAFTRGEQLHLKAHYEWSDVPEFHIPICPVLDLQPRNQQLKRQITIELPTWCSTSHKDFQVKVMAKYNSEDKEWKGIKSLLLDNSRKVTFQANLLLVYGLFMDTKAYFSSLFTKTPPVLVHISILLYHKNRRSFAVLLCFQNAAAIDERREVMERAGYQDALPPGEEIRVPLGGTVKVTLECAQPNGVLNRPQEYEFPINENFTASCIPKYSHLSRGLQPHEDLHLNYRISATGNEDIAHPVLLLHEEPQAGVSVHNLFGHADRVNINPGQDQGPGAN